MVKTNASGDGRGVLLDKANVKNRRSTGNRANASSSKSTANGDCKENSVLNTDDHASINASKKRSVSDRSPSLKERRQRKTIRTSSQPIDNVSDKESGKDENAN